MAAPPPSRPARTLAALGLALLVLFAWIALTARPGAGGQWTPRLGLDLEGGTSITLLPRVQPGQEDKVNDDSIRQAVEIIRKRVDSFGVSESEVTAQGSGSQQNILITIPGRPGGDTLELVGRTAELRFRQVLAAEPAGPAAAEAPATPAPSSTARPSGSASPSPRADATGSPSATPRGSGSASPTSAGRAVPRALLAATPSPAATPTASPAATPTARPATPTPAPSGPVPPPAPADPAQAQLTPALQQQLERLDCAALEPGRLAQVDLADRPLVTCSQDGTEKYVLAKAELQGTDVSDATSGQGTNAQGNVIPGQWRVQLDFTAEGRPKWADFTTRIVGQRVAVVLDGRVVSAPSVNDPITGGQTEITGSFSQSEAADLANVLKYGALPLSFDPGTVQEVSPELGGEQLRAGLLAGAIGLGLVVVYSLAYYRGLGLVSMASLLVAGLLTYGAVVLLGNTIGFRLSLAGIAGLIVAIGIAADSFVVFFERLRDEVRDGRSLRVAVETGWVRARRTILAADFVSLLAAAVLFTLSVGAVQGFAFTLGLTTLIDVVVVFLFTKPLVALLTRTRFFGGGHPLSGLDARRLGVTPSTPAPGRRDAAPAGATAMTKEA